VWKVPRLTNNSRIRTGYSTEKPPDLILRLIETFTNELDTVVDPCCGSGASGVAASQCNRKYLGFDINPVAIETATNRKLS
jgi:site-specific DNA-methyltransferase (adenine-specific)